eukprot:g5902.t1
MASTRPEKAGFTAVAPTPPGALRWPSRRRPPPAFQKVRRASQNDQASGNRAKTHADPPANIAANVANETPGAAALVSPGFTSFHAFEALVQADLTRLAALDGRSHGVKPLLACVAPCAAVVLRHSGNSDLPSAAELSRKVALLELLFVRVGQVLGGAASSRCASAEAARGSGDGVPATTEDGSTATTSRVAWVERLWRRGGAGPRERALTKSAAFSTGFYGSSEKRFSEASAQTNTNTAPGKMIFVGSKTTNTAATQTYDDGKETDGAKKKPTCASRAQQTTPTVRALVKEPLPTVHCVGSVFAQKKHAATQTSITRADIEATTEAALRGVEGVGSEACGCDSDGGCAEELLATVQKLKRALALEKDLAEEVRAEKVRLEESTKELSAQVESLTAAVDQLAEAKASLQREVDRWKNTHFRHHSWTKVLGPHADANSGGDYSAAQQLEMVAKDEHIKISAVTNPRDDAGVVEKAEKGVQTAKPGTDIKYLPISVGVQTVALNAVATPGKTPRKNLFADSASSWGSATPRINGAMLALANKKLAGNTSG